MTANQLNAIITAEYEALKALLGALDEQFEYIAKKEVFKLDSITKELESCSKNVAKFEVERRKLTEGRAMSEIVTELKDEALDSNYRKVKALLEEIQLQKDTNETLIRQGIGFTTQMLNLINPDKAPKTYNSYGRRR